MKIDPKEKRMSAAIGVFVAVFFGTLAGLLSTF